MALSLLQRALATARSKSESSPIAPLPFFFYCFPPTITADSLRGGVRLEQRRPLRRQPMITTSARP